MVFFELIDLQNLHSIGSTRMEVFHLTGLVLQVFFLEFIYDFLQYMGAV